MYLRPSELKDMVLDFGGFGGFGQNYFNVTTGLNPNDHGIQYFIMGTGQSINNPPQIINQNGSNGTDYSVQKMDNIARGYMFKRPLNGPGFYSDNIKYYSKLVMYSPADPRYNETRPYLVQSDEFNYFIFQKAIASVSIDGLSITSGKLVNTEINAPIIIDGSMSRGCEQGFQITLLKRDNTFHWVEAIAEVDYVSIQNPETPNYYTLTLLQENEYKIIIKAIGYDSNTNPYGYSADTRDLIVDNTDSVVFKLNTGVESHTDLINLPPIYPIIQGESDDNGEFSKIYANKEFIVSPNIDYSAASWYVNSQQIFPTNADWLDELQNQCIVKLHVLDSNNNDIIPPKTGIGPHRVTIPVAVDYKLKYITTLR